MNTRLTPCVLTSLIFVAVGCSPPKPDYGDVFDPNEPDKRRKCVDTDDREAMGLSPLAWAGVVHPNVFSTLDTQDATVKEMRERLARGRDGVAFDTLTRIQFPGMVYVQVHLKPAPKESPARDDADAIDALERKVLASLSAQEFHARLVFKDVSGFIGFANRSALDQLMEHPDVAGVCLDNMPFPLPYGTVFQNYLPPAQEGDVPVDAPGVKEGIVSSDVYRAFQIYDRVDVMIALDRRSIPKLTSDPALARQRYFEYEKAETALAKRVLETLTADDFWVATEPMPLSGSVTQEGLRKLSLHPEVLKVGLPGLAKTSGDAGEE